MLIGSLLLMIRNYTLEQPWLSAKWLQHWAYNPQDLGSKPIKVKSYNPAGQG